MVGGGGEAPPPLNGGEFLLHLLKNPHHQPPPPPHPSHTLPHDPAVAAVGPTIPVAATFPPSFSSNGHDLPYRPPFAPHNYLNGQGFPVLNPNPNPNPCNWPSSSSSSSPSSSGSNFPVRNTQLHNKNFFDDLAKLGFSNRNQQEQNNLVFGSVPTNGNFDSLGLVGKVDGFLLKEREIGVVGNRRLNAMEVKREPPLQVNYRATESTRQVVRPPPGFANRPRDVGRRGFEHNVSRGKGNSSSNGNSGERGLIGQIDEPGPSRGGNLHSVPTADIEVSGMELHRREEEDKSELDELDEKVVDLALEDGGDEKSDKKKHPKSRDKDYRSDKRGQWILNQRMRNFKSQTECRNDINRLNAPFLAIFESLIPAEEEKMKQKQLLTLLDKHVTKEWPDARLYLYGSCANSFGFRKSDIDVCLAIEDPDVNKADILLKLADILQADNLENVQALTRARVPIVKLMDPATGISCDICVNNVLAVINTKLLRDYSKIDGRLRQLAFIVKHWAKSRGVNETYQGTLSSYAYVLMCIHFLQQRRPSILPCLQGMERTYSVTVDDIECAYFDQVEKLLGFGSHNGESIAQLVWGFFNYWAYCHDYTNDVISVRAGRLISKRAKDWTRRVGNDRHLICIEDPFEVTHDLGRVVDKHSIRVLREEFERAAEILQYDPDPCVTLFQPYVPT